VTQNHELDPVNGLLPSKSTNMDWRWDITIPRYDQQNRNLPKDEISARPTAFRAIVLLCKINFEIFCLPYVVGL